MAANNGITASINDHMAVQTRRKAPFSVFNMPETVPKALENTSV
jgi:hypothetical protein